MKARSVQSFDKGASLDLGLAEGNAEPDILAFLLGP